MPKHITESTTAAITATHEYTTGTCSVTSGATLQVHQSATFTYPVNAYVKTMTGDETFTFPSVPFKIYVLNPNGANRAFDPSGTFTSGFMAIVINSGGAFNIIVDSTGTAFIVTPGSMAFAIYDGTQWR